MMSIGNIVVSALRACALVSLLGMLSPAVSAAGYTLTITPRFSPEELLKRITPLSEKLSEALGEPVQIVMSTDFADMENRMLKGQIDIAYVNPVIYPRASAAHEAVAISSKGEGGAKLRGLVITRADSDLISPTDLKGRSVVIVGYTSGGGYLSQLVALRKQGIEPETDMRLKEAKDNKQENVALSVYLGDAEAGFLREDALHIADTYVPPSQIRVIFRGEWMPSWAISVKRSLPQKVKDKIRETVLGLSAGSPELQALKVDGFVPGSDADYDVYRTALGLPIPKR